MGLTKVDYQGVRYQLFYRNRPRNDISSPGMSLLQSYGIKVLDSDDTETARSKIEDEIRCLPTATWKWENQSPENELGDLRVFQRLPAVRRHEQTGKQAFFNNAISRHLNAKKAGPPRSSSFEREWRISASSLRKLNQAESDSLSFLLLTATQRSMPTVHEYCTNILKPPFKS